MSSVRSLYRHILKLSHQASLTYKDPDALCFAVFGIMLRMDDFALAGYGTTPREITRFVFTRPLIQNDPQDSFAVRLSAGFDSLRRLTEIVSAQRKQQPDNATDSVRKLESQPEKSAEEESGEDDGPYVVAKGTIFIEGSLSRKVRRISRHVVVCKDKRVLPPYRYMFPPEPLYPKNTRVSFKLPLMRDAIICIASSNIRRNGENSFQMGTKGLLKEEYSALFNTIPTRTVTVTNHMEIELHTEYICSRYTDEEYDAEPLFDCPEETPPDRPSDSGTGKKNVKQNIFRYRVFIRNYGASRNTKKWHAQVLSRHWVLFDDEAGTIREVVGPGVMGNLPLLAPGESHTYDSGTSMSGPRGVIRGTLQVNVFNEYGEVECIDVRISPTRLSIPEE